MPELTQLVPHKGEIQVCLGRYSDLSKVTCKGGLVRLFKSPLFPLHNGVSVSVPLEKKNALYLPETPRFC